MSSSRIIIKNLPKKISEEKFRQHFAKLGEITDAKLKYCKDGKFRQFGFIGYKTEEDATKAISYFNNTFIDASKIVVETCNPLNSSDQSKRPWSKYSKDSSAFLKTNPEAKQALKEANKVKKKESKEEKKDKKLEQLVGPLKDDKEFIEFLEANKVIKSKENIWKNDITLNIQHQEQEATEIKPVEKQLEVEEIKKESSTEIKPIKNDEYEADFENGRIYVRNLHYGCKEEDLETLFKPYGPLVEVNMPIDNFSKKPKGFAHITCMFPEKALKAFSDLDGKIFQGRMLHILPGKTKEDPAHSAENETLSFKKKKELEQKKKAQSNHNWNSLFINADSVANLMAARYNVDKSQLFDVHTATNKNKAGNSIAVKLAVGETQIVNDMRKFLIRNGVKLDSFNTTERSKTVILIKNLPNNTTENEIRELLKKQGVNDMKRLVMPEYGIACLIEFSERQEARDCFKKLAYKKFKTVPLYLEWAPVDIFDGDQDELEKIKQEDAAAVEEEKKKEQELNNVPISESTTKQIEEQDDEDEYEENATLFVKNLNFDTDENSLQKMFSKIGKCKATIARKLSTNKESLSMGYGFVRFKKASHATEAIKTLQNEKLDGHNLELKFSNRTSNASNNNKKSKSTTNKINDKKSSKILVRNIPFEAKAKEIEELFRVFGELKYVRLPKKVDGAHRGFGFVDFVTVNDAERAFESLSHSTHFFGRRLVLEWAQPEQSQDVEILRMKEEQLSGPAKKRLKKSNILEDLDREENEKMTNMQS